VAGYTGSNLLSVAGSPAARHRISVRFLTPLCLYQLPGQQFTCLCLSVLGIGPEVRLTVTRPAASPHGGEFGDVDEAEKVVVRVEVGAVARGLLAEAEHVIVQHRLALFCDPADGFVVVE